MKNKQVNRYVVFVFIILVICFVYGQHYEVSKEFELTHFNYSEFSKLSENNNFNGYMPIYLKDKKGVRLKEFYVFAETYENDGFVQELYNVKFTNIKKIISVNISNCACYCNSTIYYWLITSQNKWIALPEIEEEDYETSLSYHKYVFSDGNENRIDLIKYQDALVDNNETIPRDIRRESEKTIKTYFWDSKKLNKKNILN